MTVHDQTDFDTQCAPDEDTISTDEGTIVLVPEPTREQLNTKQRTDYRHHREELINWMLHLGKDPDSAKGYSFDVVRRRSHDTDIFYRWVWENYDGYTTAITTDHADAYTQELAYSDYSESHKSNIQKSLKMFFRWKGVDWEPKITFTGSTATSPQDYLTREERQRLREAALEWDSIPAYAAMSPEERQRWKEYLSYQYDKPVSAVQPSDFENAEGFKYASLICVSLDAGLRPIEVGRATVQWVDIDNAVLRIPKEESSKNRENWIVSLRRSTAELLQNWLRERQLYDKYEDSSQLWLTRHGNPYSSSSLKYVLEKIAEVADINTENRSLTWYSLRHSVGTYMAREEGLAAAQSQLRHQSPRTTFKYDQAPIEDRRNALDRMG
ncbi:site-specific integrase [Haloterrigena salifodinae]|uniref:Site-specific integrase n=1 Tax=Haloterrigena salifodinae TaxID=2675099 RepID=A0A8T8E1E8_9EURY|nr:site-specific integrase [Haloterrigena salifodinae]QRV15457.1 site-specific integrase [Haloterrigena salifodinae]